MDEPTLAELRVILSFANLHIADMAEDGDMPAEIVTKSSEVALKVQKWLFLMEMRATSQGEQAASINLAYEILADTGMLDGVEHILVLSTANIMQSTSENITKYGIPGLTCHTLGLHGLLITAPSEYMLEVLEPQHDYPQDLVACFKQALKQHCTWVLFDQDAVKHEALMEYDW